MRIRKAGCHKPIVRLIIVSIEEKSITLGDEREKERDKAWVRQAGEGRGKV